MMTGRFAMKIILLLYIGECQNQYYVPFCGLVAYKRSMF